MHENVKNDISVKNIEFVRNNLIFKGRLTIPSDPATCKGIVVFMHGLGYCYKSYNIDDRFFAEEGWAFLRYNLRGHVGSEGEWTIPDSVDDLGAYLDFIDRELVLPNKSNIGFFAHSTGGLIALLTYLKDKRFKFGSITNLITSLKVSYYWWFKSGYNSEVQKYFALKGILDSKVQAFFEDETWFKNVEENKINLKEYSFPYRYGFLRGNTFHTFLHEIRNSPDILEKVSNIKIPLIMFKSKSDEVINNSLSDKFFGGLTIAKKKIIEVEPEEGTLKHFLLRSWPDIEKESIEFFNKNCR